MLKMFPPTVKKISAEAIERAVETWARLMSLSVDTFLISLLFCVLFGGLYFCSKVVFLVTDGWDHSTKRRNLDSKFTPNDALFLAWSDS